MAHLHAISFVKTTGKLQEHLWEQVMCALHKMEGKMGACSGGSHDGLLLLSVRSGAAVSMPGEHARCLVQVSSPGV